MGLTLLRLTAPASQHTRARWQDPPVAWPWHPQEVAEPGVEIFEHLFYDIEKELVLELDDIERDLGLPLTPVPELKSRLTQ